ncbi:hypothetical protein CGMCC3_g17766 [Colletotrichum fructicola]|uniref:DUF7730 domain-containing protein n=1 Tax=Colletotrichum fructicola (strain Nara gc5) TaxID=1213859 RepID=A0A7J6IDS9_COLFN|nr:uncharacterized protein CGMCC3_g17766 [Colletotrichum fructicola]KAE9566060.1 hypothetical protein CGMCC3_g17766 [Colletotrichum fructicola]KAF4417134.1 hypothetical protein CFRS1_v015851 [Colletotrichum fructicola]KAF4417961.1 hypothetical protein CFRS1_v015374 [Colletotrichum fructicola]KAF4474020.1 hypothetical protein CGGC5_v017089 [Colletotrichum fructicola Nara gc5]
MTSKIIYWEFVPLLLRTPVYSFDDLGSLHAFLRVTPAWQLGLMTSVDIAWFVTGPIMRPIWHPFLTRRLFPSFRAEQLQQWVSVWDVISEMEGLIRIRISLLAPHWELDSSYSETILRCVAKAAEQTNLNVVLYRTPRSQALTCQQETTLCMRMRNFYERVMWKAD